MHQLKHLPGRTVQIDNEPWLYFSGTGYLGAAWNEGLQNLVRAGMQQYGLHFGGSRLSNIQLNIFAEAEEFLANYAGAEKALLLSSGTLAGQLLMRVLSQYGEVLAAPGAHPAIWANAVPEVNFFTFFDGIRFYRLREFCPSLAVSIRRIGDPFVAFYHGSTDQLSRKVVQKQVAFLLTYRCFPKKYQQKSNRIFHRYLFTGCYFTQSEKKSMRGFSFLLFLSKVKFSSLPTC